jgi:threonylcarbamoyladenosine tRNA methylthiotransferase MtaB
MRIAFATVGCRLNQFETDALRGKAEADGYTVVPFGDEADVYVINTCTITGEADADSRQLVRRAVRRNPAAVVAVTGCYAQAAPERLAAIPGVDLVLGNIEKAALLQHLRDAAADGLPRIRVADISGRRRSDGDEYGPGIDPDRTRAFLKVQDGCSYACSFCIVPTVRGPNRSLPLDRILAEIRRLHTAGFPEVVLTGIHLGTYGRDLAPRATLVELCARIAELPEAPRVRLSSLDPHEVGPDLIRLLRASPRFCRHLHLPLQSGDDAVLTRMRRAHTAEAFRTLVERLAADIPGIAVTADVIVGFPGEDGAAFRRTYDLLAPLPVAGLHVFRFSPRAGTEAAAYPDQASKAVKAARSRELRALAAEKGQAFRRQFLDETLEVVVLHRDRPNGMLEGLSDNYLTVGFPGEGSLMGRLVRVRVQGLAAEGVSGQFCGLAH